MAKCVSLILYSLNFPSRPPFLVHLLPLIQSPRIESTHLLSLVEYYPTVSYPSLLNIASIASVTTSGRKPMIIKLMVFVERYSKLLSMKMIYAKFG